MEGPGRKARRDTVHREIWEVRDRSKIKSKRKANGTKKRERGIKIKIGD